MAQTKKLLTAPIPRHRVLREIYRHYLEYRALVMTPQRHEHGRTDMLMDGVINHGYYIYHEDGTVKDKVIITISFWDLFNGLKELSPRKREAVWYNVIMDQKQRDVATRMGITTVSVGQYVEQACIQLAERYFAEEVEDVEKG